MPYTRDPPNLPPLPKVDPQFPVEAPIDSPLIDLVPWWLVIRCGECGHRSDYPIRLLASLVGWRVSLGEAVARLVCDCGRRPTSVILNDNPARLTFAHGGGSLAKQIELLVR